jgi:outer membrane protein assembly factor BamB
MMPTFIPSSTSTPHGQDTIVLGQKNGNLYVLSTQAGTPFWVTSTGPDGNVGGLVWGIAVDDSRVYYATLNSNLDTWTVQPSNQAITNSAFGAMDLASGAILWETPSPQRADQCGATNGRQRCSVFLAHGERDGAEDAV